MNIRTHISITFCRTICVLGCLSLVNACQPSAESKDAEPSGGDKTQAIEDQNYFSLQTFFKDEAVRLSKQSSTLSKIVKIQEKSEQKTITVKDWNQELHVFAESDINKPAWKGLYKIDSTSSEITYRALQKDLRTQKITIKKDSLQHVKAILIANLTQNNLYTTEENLAYYPDSLYRIETHQSIRILGNQSYLVTATWN